MDAGDLEADRVPGLVGLETLKDDWHNWNDRPWLGLAAARTAHRDDASFDRRWYRRRASMMPPQAAAAYRPIEVAAVEAAAERTPTAVEGPPEAVGIDVARSGDHTVMVGVHGDDLRVHYSRAEDRPYDPADPSADVSDRWH